MTREKSKKAESLADVHTHAHTHGSLKKEKGITLIALVISIIVLLILARSSNKLLKWRKPAY